MILIVISIFSVNDLSFGVYGDGLVDKQIGIPHGNAFVGFNDLLDGKLSPQGIGNGTGINRDFLIPDNGCFQTWIQLVNHFN